MDWKEERVHSFILAAAIDYANFPRLLSPDFKEKRL